MSVFYGSKLTIPEQTTYGTPNDQINTNNGSGNWSVEFSRYVSNYVKTFGNDIVLSGFNLSGLILNSSWLGINVEAGRCIQDQTVIYTTNTVQLVLPYSADYSTYTKALISTDYKYYFTSDSSRPDRSRQYDDTLPEYPTQEGFNPFKVRIDYYDGSNSVSGWDTTVNRIVLGRIDFTISEGAFTDATLVTLGTATVNDVTYNFQAGGYKLSGPFDGGELD